MTDHETDGYAEWLKQRRSVTSKNDLTDRIMSELVELTASSQDAPSTTAFDNGERSCSLAADVSAGPAEASTRLERPGHRSSIAELWVRGRDRIGPGLLLTAAALFFAVKIVSLVGNLAFPTESYPEFANDHQIEEPANEHGNPARS